MFTLYCPCGYPFLVERKGYLSLWKGANWTYSFTPNLVDDETDAVTHCPGCGKQLKIEKMKSLGELELD